MDLRDLLAGLTDPAAYPHPTGPVEVRHTHISAVFLAGPYAYKVKKPLDLGFLDFTTLARRRHYCAEEVRLNGRLAPRVYLGLVPIALRRGELRVDGEGEAVEWAVWMERLPDDATLLARLGRGEEVATPLDELAHRLARFHAGAPGGAAVARAGRWATVARNLRENFAPGPGTEAGEPRVVEGVRRLTEEALAAHRGLIEARAEAGVPRDTHGDLHLDHVYLLPDRPPPDDLAILDCVEFSERFRHADPVADAAFLAMDLAYRGRRDLGRRFAAAYRDASGDREGEPLWPLYQAYRAAVRAKVDGVKGTEPEVPPAARARALASVRAHWLVALGALEAPARRPALVLVGGLPGTGKSTLARGLAEAAGFTVIASDRVRKELAGLAPDQPAPAGVGEGLYRPEAIEETYRECLRRAEAAVAGGGRALVDATFGADRHRQAFLATAQREGAPGLFLRCRTEPEAIRRRLAARVGGPSDATWAVYRRAAEAWEPASPEVARSQRDLSPEGEPGRLREEALGFLREEGLA